MQLGNQKYVSFKMCIRDRQRVRLAIVEALWKKPADFPEFLRLMDESGFAVKHGRGGVISFLAPGQDLSLIHILWRCDHPLCGSVPPWGDL